ncbi:polysaccharide biosynthesis tyrosine autokinase [Georgenia halophila]|uniref:Polysaccharide biosynthesis tyrosine autokinase n=1 Tax=Georgenia halophila TaxID=620889 RepID=A0ABP8KTI0_9MICO
MELRDYVTVLRSRWLLASLVAVSTIAATALVTLLMTPSYTAETRMYFSIQGEHSIAELQQGSTFTQAQLSSYAEVATSPFVLEPVIEEMGLDATPGQLAERLTVDVPPGTTILTITSSDQDAHQAATLANAVAAELSRAASELSPSQADGMEPVSATIVSPAVAPSSPSSPNVVLNLALGLVIGVVLGVAAAVLRHMLDTKVRDQEDVADVTDSPVVGVVSFEPDKATQHIFMDSDPMGVRAEAVRRLRTNLQFYNVDRSSISVVVTSSVPGEGKSITSVNLAVALADAGARVLLVDGDLRRPSLAEYTGLEGGAGLTTVLIGRAELEDVVQPWRQSSLWIVPAGPTPPNPSELLGSATMAEFMERASAMYDVVLYDSPPLLPVTDAAVLSRRAAGTLVVAGADRIHRAQLRESLSMLEAVGARVIGVALNKVQQSRLRQRYYYGTYGSDDDGGGRSRPGPAPSEPREVQRRAKRTLSSQGSTRAKAQADGSRTQEVPNAQPVSGRGAATSSESSRTTWPGRPLSGERRGG